MADPQRLLADPEASPLGRALLASVEGDAMPAQSRARIAGKLGIAATLALTTTTAGQGLAAALWWKIGTVLIALTGVTALAISQTPGEPPQASEPPSARTRPAAGVPLSTKTADEAPAETTAPPPSPTTRLAEVTGEPVGATSPPPSPTPGPEPVGAASPPPSPTTRPATSPTQPTEPRRPTQPAEATRPAEETSPTQPAEPRRPTQPAEHAPRPTPPAEVHAPPKVPAQPELPAKPAPVKVDARRLAAEVALLDRARTAVRARDAQAAAAALGEYARTFPHGALVAEAEAVNIELLVQRGDAAAAAARARAFLARFPHSPLARRVRSLALAGEAP